MHIEKKPHYKWQITPSRFICVCSVNSHLSLSLSFLKKFAPLFPSFFSSNLVYIPISIEFPVPMAAASILVTGGAGYIGSHTVLQLLNSGFNVVALDNLDNSSEIAIRRVAELAGDKGKNMTFRQVLIWEF